jgi:hypothetical protein
MKGTLSLRSNLAANHLRAAAHAARKAYDVEQAGDTTVFGAWFDDVMMAVPVAVIMAGAALEANANETIKDLLDGATGIPITNSQRMLLTDLFDDRSGNSIDRYKRLASLLGKKPKLGNESWENAKLLVKFRNSFLHFKPAWDREKDVHEGKLTKSLMVKLPICEAYKGSLLFPYVFMNFACARWAVRNVLAFSAEFSSILEINDRFVRQQSDFELP